MPNKFFRKTFGLLFCLFALVATGCKREAPGTSDNLRADYDRVVQERDELKADFEKQRQDIESVWQQRVSDKDEKIAELTSDDASLRQRLLVADAATQDVPLADSARARSLMWLHVIYLLIIASCLALVAIVLWVHVNLRERVRVYVMQQAKFIPMKEAANVQ